MTPLRRSSHESVEPTHFFVILTGPEIKKERAAGRIWIEPFAEKNVQPNSYDFALGSVLLRYTDSVLDAARDNPYEFITIGPQGYLLDPSRIVLGHTVEVMGSNSFVPIIRGRSSFARLGLFIHVTADLIDIGSRNQWTLQLHCVQPLRLYAGMRIGQVTFWSVKGEIILYTGKYQGSRGPHPSLCFRDMKETGIL
jgi:dCTP deaminase